MLSLAPFLQLAFLLVAGILSYRFVPEPYHNLLPVWVLLVLICICISFGIYFLKRKCQRRSMGSFSVACILMGFSGAAFHGIDAARQNALTSESYVGYIAIIKSLPEKRAQSIRYEAEITHLIQHDKQQRFFGRALIQIPSDADEILRPGHIIQTKQLLKKPIGAMNPGSFDYGQYLAAQGIHYVDYLRTGQYSILGNVSQNFNPVRWSYYLSDKADEIFRLHIKDDDAYGLVKAMILGRRDDLKNELVDAFTISGAVHILSVSGLHVGIFFIVIQSALGWLRRFRGGRYIQLVLLCIMLLIYGLMTGMPASVERSIIMCILLAIASTFLRNQVPLNTLGIAAFLILLLDPMAVYSIGFQLSFLAMVGLMVFNKPIDNSWKIQNQVGRYIWSMISATVAAQLTTLPLTLFYFHQFPTWFLLVNPLVIAISSVLLPAAFLLLVISWVPVTLFSNLVGFIVTWSAVLTNYCVTIPSKLPMPVIENIPFDFVQMMLLLSIIMFFGWYGLYKKKGEVVTILLVICLIFSSYSVAQQFIKRNRTTLVIHSLRNDYLVSILDEGHLFLVASQPLDELNYKYILKDYVIKNDVSGHTYILPGQVAEGKGWSVNWIQKSPDIQFHDNKITSSLISDTSKIARHFLIPDRRLSFPPDDQLLSANFVVLNNRLTFRQRAEWREWLDKNNLAYSDLVTDGAYIIRK